METINLNENKSIDIISCKNDKSKIALLGGLVGLIVFLVIYGMAPLNPTNDAFVLSGYLEKDVAQHYAGWKLFRNSEWTFPLGVGSHIEYPYGNSVSYTDSIPLFAIFFKAISSFLPQTFQYFGIFVLMCFILQGVFGALLVSLFAECKVYCSIGALFFCLAPVMVERAFRHCALTAHFLILAALYYYFNNRRKSIKSYIPFYIINILAITIHPYFLPFTFAIMFAFAVEDFLIARSWIKPWLHIILSIVITLAVGYSIGAFYSGEVLGAVGYGYFSMNLNSYINPVSPHFSGENNWSEILSDRSYFGGQNEGFNYIGVGVLAAAALSLVAVIITQFKKVFRFIFNRFGIIFSTVCLTVFAFSNAVYFDDKLLMEIPYPEELQLLFGMFRATGRFGWILFYLAFLLALYGIYTAVKNPKIACAVIVPFLILQVYDLSGVLKEKHDYFYNFSTENRQYEQLVAQHPFWEDAIQNVDGVIEVGDIHNPLFGNGMIDLASICGTYNKTMNSCFCARFNYHERYAIAEYSENLFEQGMHENYLYVFEERIFRDTFYLTKNDRCQVFVVDGQYVLVPFMYDEEQVAEYTALGNFKELDYYDIVFDNN